MSCQVSSDKNVCFTILLGGGLLLTCNTLQLRKLDPSSPNIRKVQGKAKRGPESPRIDAKISEGKRSPIKSNVKQITLKISSKSESQPEKAV